MTAEEMFNKLGYYKNYNNCNNYKKELFFFEKKDDNAFRYKEILFYKDKKFLISDYENYIDFKMYSPIVDINLFKAINKQIEELDWDD